MAILSTGPLRLDSPRVEESSSGKRRTSQDPVLELNLIGKELFFLQQAIALEPGASYRIGAEIRTEEVEGSVSLQMDFFDAYGGSMFQDITKTPMGELFTGSNHWTSDSFEVRVPFKATYGELRLFLHNRGRALIKNVMLSKI